MDFFNSLSALLLTPCLHVVSSLIQNKICRMPVMDSESGNTLHIFTYKHILKGLKLFAAEFPKPEFISKSLEELQVSTQARTAMVHTTTPVYMTYFVQR